jgi:hypothetical protein
MVEAARKEAQELVEKDPGLQKYPLIAKRLLTLSTELHME